ncbi:protein Mis18-alpha [Gadus morhua]|uniref:Protein Mis18-alpha n=1 Tax=Gadus morhua TaxID=8049 RepID=A0A8C4ZJB3_GADMO|nr:protein Mis18-alpha [Gadus morhua]
MASKSSRKVDSKHRAFDVEIDNSTRIFQGSEDTFNLVEDKEDGDAPVVFFCGNCNLPIGDSLSWAGSDNESQIYLKRVTENVLVGKEQRIYQPKPKHRCLILDLCCKGCKSELGMLYLSTPKALDCRRLTFCFLVKQLESYVLGSANQKVAEESPPKLPLTVEDRGDIEQQLIEMKTLVLSMAQRMEKIEEGLQPDLDESLP